MGLSLTVYALYAITVIRDLGHVRDLEKSLNVKGQGALRQTRTYGTFLSIGTHRPRASVYPL